MPLPGSSVRKGGLRAESGIEDSGLNRTASLRKRSARRTGMIYFIELYHELRGPLVVCFTDPRIGLAGPPWRQPGPASQLFRS